MATTMLKRRVTRSCMPNEDWIPMLQATSGTRHCIEAPEMQSSTHPCVFLIGLHGVGKTTLGRHLHARHGWLHLSLGDLSRLARARRLPREFGVRLMGALAGQIPGERLKPQLISALLQEVERHRLERPVSIDGFPTEPYHLQLIQPDSRIVHLRTDDAVRNSRLEHRSVTTARQWTAQAAPAPRDRDLPLILEKLRESTFLHHLNADQPVENLAQLVLELTGS